ncbi:PTI1-like tyrosine-protein kinase [Platanthera guangdongensis]|uniref:PTI1-like tyrosine-protein kinase n=1 Tax=Platanthera guangdongensis TaxID=2320717 RepID=A0ABR2MXM8_9ASPA
MEHAGHRLVNRRGRWREEDVRDGGSSAKRETGCGFSEMGEMGCERKDSRRKTSSWRIFSLKELHAATNNFNYDNKIGEGGFGSVYWGQLWDGSQIAVKRLKVWSNKAEMEFAVEVEILGRVRHKNLLSLRGYCAEGQERLIVYDFMPNLSLLAHLHGQHSAECLLDWGRRMNIAVGSAEALALCRLGSSLSRWKTPVRKEEKLKCSRARRPPYTSLPARWLILLSLFCRYLHHHSTPHIIHRDIKASNVLLDSNFQAQVADFGFAKLIPDGATHVTTRVKGTLGYLAPEYAMFGKASESCDVYSFAILLLELVSGRKPLEKLSPTVKRSIADWALPLAKEKRFSEMADPKLNGNYVESELKRMVLVALVCAHCAPEKRPTMLEVTDLLKGELKEKLADLENDDIFQPDVYRDARNFSPGDLSSDCVSGEKDSEDDAAQNADQISLVESR